MTVCITWFYSQNVCTLILWPVKVLILPVKFKKINKKFQCGFNRYMEK